MSSYFVWEQSSATIDFMRRLLLLWFASASWLVAQDKPLTSLPYTPSLDTTFMDKTADPCTDFYQFACGNWNRLNPIPPDQARWDVYSKLANENERLLWGILEAAANPGASRTANEQKIGDFFGSCMDVAATERKGAEPIVAALERIAKLDSVYDIAAFIASEQSQGFEAGMLFGFGSNPDFDDSSREIAFMGAGGLGLPDRDYYTKSDAKSQEIRQHYVAHVQKMLELIGERSTDAQADAQAVMQIETALAQASLTRVEQRDPYNLKHKITREQLIQMAPQFNWDSYFAGIAAPRFTIVNVTEPKFYSELNQQLREKNLAAWRAYLRWHTVDAAAPYLSSAFEQEDFNFFGRYLTGTTELPPRWKKCTRLVDRELGEALGEVFVDKTFSPRTKQEALRMTQQIEQEMGQQIRTLPWMSDATKQQALVKLHAVVNKIGYPNKWRDYSSVTIRPDDFLGNVERAAHFEEQRDLNKIGKPVDRSEWDMTPPTVNAYYDPQMNDINFPAGVLQPPLFDPKMDAAPNYGNTGSTIGHELTHGFDDEGRQFDAQGNLKDWWTDVDAKQFEQRVACVRNQYAQYTIVDDIKINSRLTLGEDVADLGGTLLAYLAWEHDTQGQELKSMNGLTPEQRFFVGMAQWACGDERPASKRMHALTDPHSPTEYRVNGVVSDMPEFGAAFGCKIGQPMMRQNACRVW